MTDALPAAVPPSLRGYTVVASRRGRAAVARPVGGPGCPAPLGPGEVSLRNGVEAGLPWPTGVEVVRVALTRDELVRTCRAMFEREVAEVALPGQVTVMDPAIHRIALQIAGETTHGTAGSRLMVEALSAQLTVHVLRRHARVRFRGPDTPDGLDPAQERRVREHVLHNLDAPLTLDELAGVAGLSRSHFARRFRRSTGTTPHEFVLRARVERARALLDRTGTPLFEVAARCGFADQSHLTREFRKRVGTTPGRYRGR